MELSDFESFHYLYRALWQQEGDGEIVRHKINMMDTIIFQHGIPFRWIFTSEQTGEVLKKKNCQVTPSEIVSILKKRSGKLRGKKLNYHDRTKFACVWYRDPIGRLVLRLLDEAELYFLLGDHTYTQFISAIQVFFNGYPLRGIGIFEHNFINTSITNPTSSILSTYKTFEFLSLPPPIDMIEFSKQTLTRDYHGTNHLHPIDINTPSIDWKGNISDSHQTSFPYTNDKVLITGAHEDILKIKTNQIIKLLENTINSKIIKISLIYFFNTSLTPFVVSCKKIVIEPNGNHKNKFLSFNTISNNNNNNNNNSQNNDNNNNNNNNNNNIIDEEIEIIKNRELNDQNEIFNKLQSDLTSSVKFAHINKYNRMESKGDIEVIGVLPSNLKNINSKKGNHNSQNSTKHPIIQRTTTDIYGTPEDHQIKREIFQEVLKHSKEQDQLDEEGIDQIYHAKIPHKTEIRSKFGGKRLTMLDNFISLSPNKNQQKEQPKSPNNTQNLVNNNSYTSLNPNNSGSNHLTNTLLENYKIGIENAKLPGDSIKTKHYAQLTDAQSYRIKSYSDRIKGSTDNENLTVDLIKRRPISAPHSSRKTLNSTSRSDTIKLHFNQEIDDNYQGVHGTEVGGTRASGLIKKLSHQGHTCWGDYCNLLSRLNASTEDTKEYLRSIGMTKVTISDGTVRIKSTQTDYQVTCKSILLARTESKYIGGEVSVMENIESYEYMEADVLNACAHQHIQKVAEKCRKEAFSSLVHNGLKLVPNLSDLQVVAHKYRNMIYNDALSQVHPARFYLTVPACHICHQLYSALDQCRDDYIYRPNPQDPVIKNIAKLDDDNVSADIVQRARKVLKLKANQYRNVNEINNDNNNNNDNDNDVENNDNITNNYNNNNVMNKSPSNPQINQYGQSKSQQYMPTHQESNEFSEDGDENEDSQDHHQNSEEIRGEEEEEEEERKGNQMREIPQRNHPRESTASSASGGSDIMRRKSQLLQGHQLALGVFQNKDEIAQNTTTPSVLKQLTSTRSNGSLSSWVDLMSKAGMKSKTTHNINNNNKEEKKDSSTNFDIIERRKSIQMLRRSEKSDWRLMLRNSSFEDYQKQLQRPQSAGPSTRSSQNSHFNKDNQPSKNSTRKFSTQSQERSYSPLGEDKNQNNKTNTNSFSPRENYTSFRNFSELAEENNSRNVINPNMNSYGTISFTQAQYLPYRPKVETNEEFNEILNKEHNTNHNKNQHHQHHQQHHRVDINHVPNYYDEKEELFFLYSPPSSVQRNSNSNSNNNKNKNDQVPKAFPVEGTIADKKYKSKQINNKK